MSLVIDLTADYEHGDACPICKDPIRTEDLAHVGCPHRFCFRCISSWTRVSSCCPLCKVDVAQIELLAARHPRSSDDVVIVSMGVKRKRPDLSMWAHTIE